MKKYEIMYIIKPNLESEQIKQIIDRLTQILLDQKAEIIEYKEIGLKELAYEIEHFNRGYYVWQNIVASNEAIDEFNRVVRIIEDVLRFI
ncbi:MAG: 30S ribosomal protein S6, partial [Acholeplasmataceae bacterium]|nr:30S ribosomal protein S6 [Acholeplasmataceae bacterium]